MKRNQKTIGQGTVLKSPHPSPGVRAGAVERSCPVLPCRSCRCVGAVTAVTAWAPIQTRRTTAQQMWMPGSHLVSCEWVKVSWEFLSLHNWLALVSIVPSAVFQCCWAPSVFFRNPRVKALAFLYSLWFAFLCSLSRTYGSDATSGPVMCFKKLMGSPVYNVDIIFVKSRAELMDKSTSAISPIK